MLCILASTYICRATLDCLIYLSKNYPRHFVSAPDSPKDSLPKFWDLLMKLEKSKGTVYKKPETNDLMSIPFGESNPAENLAQLDQTILSKLLKMLRHPVIFDNRSLLDKMLHLLGRSKNKKIIFSKKNFSDNFRDTSRIERSEY